MANPFKALGFLLGLSRKSFAGFHILGLSDGGGLPRNPKGWTKDGYQSNPVAFAAIDLIAHAVASIPIIVKVKGEEKPDHDLNILIQNPNPDQAWSAFAHAQTSYKFILGEAYTQAATTTNFGQAPLDDITPGAKPLRLWMWQPYQMFPVANKTDMMPRAWVFKSDTDSITHRWIVEEGTGHSDMHQWRSFDPFNRFRGMSPLLPASLSIDAYNSASVWNKRVLDNDGKSTLAISYKGEVGTEQIDHIRKQWEENHSGPWNAGKPFIGGQDMEVTNLGFSAKDLDWLKGKKLNASETVACLGVPGQLVGIEGSQTFANYENARTAFWQDTVLPTAQDLINEYNAFLGYRYPDNPVITLVLDDVPALEEVRASTWEKVQGADFLTINEKREAVGYVELDTPEANELMIAANMIPLSLDETELDNLKSGLEARGYSTKVVESICKALITKAEKLADPCHHSKE